MLSSPAFAAQFTQDQCAVMRQVGVDTAELCGNQVTSLRAQAANYTASQPSAAAPPSSPTASRPSAPGGPSGRPSGPSSPSSPGASPGPPGGGGGSGRPGDPAPPLPTVPPPKPAITPGQIKALQEALRQRAIDRIIHGAKPPPDLGRPGQPNFDFDGKPPSFGKPPHEGAMPDRPTANPQPQGSQR